MVSVFPAERFLFCAVRVPFDKALCVSIFLCYKYHRGFAFDNFHRFLEQANSLNVLIKAVVEAKLKRRRRAKANYVIVVFVNPVWFKWRL